MKRKRYCTKCHRGIGFWAAKDESPCACPPPKTWKQDMKFLMRLVNKLPKTADGVPVYKGSVVYVVDDDGIHKAKVLHINTQIGWTIARDDQNWWSWANDNVYSDKAAAEKVRMKRLKNGNRKQD